MTHRSRHSYDLEFSGNLKIKPSWSRCDHCDDTCTLFFNKLGAFPPTHTLSVYMFGVPFLSGKYIQGEVKFTEKEEHLSKRMMNHWAQFATTGNPGWPQYRYILVNYNL